jgi:transcriptional regulator with XRE-family HTH domain
MVAKKMLVKDLIQYRRLKRGFHSQGAAADAAGVSRGTWNRWESGLFPPDEENLLRLARVLGGKPDDYRWGKEDEARRNRERMYRAIVDQAELEREQERQDFLDGKITRLDDMLRRLFGQENDQGR